MSVDLEALTKELREAGFSPRGSSQALMLRDPHVYIYADGWMSFAAFVPKSAAELERFALAVALIARHLAAAAARTEEGEGLTSISVSDGPT